MFDVLRRLPDGDLLEATYWLGLRLRVRNQYSDAAFHRALANDPTAEDTAQPPAVQDAIASVLEEIEAAERKPIHALGAEQVDPYLRMIWAIGDERRRREPADPEVTRRALQALEEMRREYAHPEQYHRLARMRADDEDAGRRKIA
jgi:hypothetical protein